MISDGVDGTGWTGTQVGYFIGAATAQFCPEHMNRVMAEADTLGG